MVRANEMKIKTLLLIAALCLSACSSEVTEQELIGVYVEDYRGDKATLTVAAGHSYTHLVRLKNGEVLSNQGTWTSTRLPSNPQYIIIEFQNFSAVPSYNDSNKNGWATELEKTLLGRIRLCFDSDVGYCYTKQ